MNQIEWMGRTLTRPSQLQLLYRLVNPDITIGVDNDYVAIALYAWPLVDSHIGGRAAGS
jgi:hypothetical protein